MLAFPVRRNQPSQSFVIQLIAGPAFGSLDISTNTLDCSMKGILCSSSFMWDYNVVDFYLLVLLQPTEPDESLEFFFY